MRTDDVTTDTLETASDRRLALGGIVGPTVFIAAWIGCGLAKEGYSPVDDAISRLAADGASTRWVMTVALLVYAVGLAAYGVAARRAGAGPTWVAAGAAGACTLGVALTPLETSDTIDQLHGIAAGSGYVALTLTALLAARTLRARGEARWAAMALGLGAVAGVSLVLTTVTEANGLFQRLGLTAADVWIVLAAVRLLRDRRVAEAVDPAAG